MPSFNRLTKRGHETNSAKTKTGSNKILDQAVGSMRWFAVIALP
jgi:hypothetical protein